MNSVTIIALVFTAVWMGPIIFASASEIKGIKKLEREGVWTTGIVVAAHLEVWAPVTTATRLMRSTRLVETIEFSTQHETYRENPKYSDIMKVDRTGLQVNVFHNPKQPSIFIAPKNGYTLAPEWRWASLQISLFYTLIVFAIIVTAFFALPG